MRRYFKLVLLVSAIILYAPAGYAEDCKEAYEACESYWELYLQWKDKDSAKADEMLRKYLASGPEDSGALFLVGEVEYERGNLKEADCLLRLAKEYSGGHSTALDWLLFKVNYLLGNYEYSAAALEEALAQNIGPWMAEDINSDARFADISKRPEYEEHRGVFDPASWKDYPIK